MQKLIEFNENQDTPLYLPSPLEDLKHKSEYFNVPDLETKIQRHDNPHHWLQQDISQVKNFQYRFFNNITLTEDTIPQIKVFTQILLKFFRFNYQLLWEQQDQQAYINFPQILTQTELLPYVIKNEHKHLQYRDPTSFNTTHLEQINLDHKFITEHFETSDNRPYITTNISPETISEEQLSNVVLQVSDLQHINPSETATIHNTSELSEETEQPEEQTEQTVQNTQSLTITNDSNLIQIPIHNITTEETNSQNQDTTSNTTQDNTSVLSTSHTNITQPSQIHRPPRQNYDPPSLPSQFVNSNNTHDSPQQGSSNTQHTNIVHFQTSTPSSPPQTQTSTYTPAQNNPFQNVQTGLNINTNHSNPPFHYTTSRHLSRPPLQPILTNPLSYNLTSTNSSHIQQSSTNNITINSLKNASTLQTSNTLPPTLQNSQFQIPNPPSTTIRTNPYFHNMSTTSFTNISKVPTYNTVQASTISQNTIPQPTYINSSTSVSEPNKPFGGLDHNYLPEESLQHIEPRVTFSLGLQPTSEHEYKFWHARRMTFIQCSLTGTALSWYIRLNDTYNQIGTLLYQPSRNNYLLKRTLILHTLKLLIYLKKTTKQCATLHSKINS